MKYTKLKDTVYDELQLNAGILLSRFTPGTGSVSVSDIIGATKGGMSFRDNITWKNYAEGIDNAPTDMKELLRVDKHEITLGGTYVSVTIESLRDLMVVGDIDEGNTKIIPRDELKEEDFKDVWWVGDYSGKNGEEGGGCIAIHLTDAINIDGLSIKSSDKDKGEFAFNYKAHYSLKNQGKVPYEIYVKTGS